MCLEYSIGVVWPASNEKFSQNLHGSSHSNLTGIFDVCLESPSDSKNQFGQKVKRMIVILGLILSLTTEDCSPRRGPQEYSLLLEPCLWVLGTRQPGTIWKSFATHVFLFPEKGCKEMKTCSVESFTPITMADNSVGTNWKHQNEPCKTSNGINKHVK